MSIFFHSKRILSSLWDLEPVAVESKDAQNPLGGDVVPAMIPHPYYKYPPSLYYQVFRKHLFAAANLKSSLELVQQKKTSRLPCLPPLGLLINTILCLLFKRICTLFFDRTLALH